MIQRSSKNEQYQLTIPLITVIGFQLMYETVVATLALTHILPPDTLICGLAERWMKLVLAKDGDAVRAVQDSFKCCGFRTLKDNAFPWGNPSQCSDIFGYRESCLGPWRKAEQVQAGLLLLVAVIVFVLKVCPMFKRLRLVFQASRAEGFDTGAFSHLSSYQFLLDSRKMDSPFQTSHKRSYSGA